MSAKYQSIYEVPVWKKSHQLALRVYKLTESFPKSELFGLISQIRRSATSIPANITEGFYRNTTKELIQFLFNARGSLGETLYHLLLAKDLGFIEKPQYEELKKEYNEVGKQLNGWIKSLRARIT